MLRLQGGLADVPPLLVGGFLFPQHLFLKSTASFHPSRGKSMGKIRKGSLSLEGAESYLQMNLGKRTLVQHHQLLGGMACLSAVMT